MATHPQPTFFVGIDWGSTSHQACILASDGTVLGEKAFPHSGDGLCQLIDWILSCVSVAARFIAVAIEVPHGPVVDSLHDRGFQVFSINPKQLDRFRDRFSPAGAKDDRRDARVLASAIRTDPACLRRTAPLDDTVIELRDCSRRAEDLKKERTRLTNQIRQQLWRYYPQFLELKVDLSAAWVLELWDRAPTPKRARRIRVSTVANLLKKHRIRRFTAKQVIDILRSKPLTVPEGVTASATSYIGSLVRRVDLIRKELTAVERKIEAILDSFKARAEPADGESTPEQSDTLPDATILASLPGVGPVVLATLLSEASGALQARDYRALRCLCGVAPVTRRSGKKRYVVRRRACHNRLVNAVYHWSRVAAQRDPVSKARYRALRARGHSHGRALRTVGDRLLLVACAMLRNATVFDPDRVAAAHANG